MNARRAIPFRRGRAAVVAALGVAGALVGCSAGEVVIGIENGLAAYPTADASSEGKGTTYDGSLGPLDDGGLMTPDGAYADADLGPCLPDGGCATGELCEYPVASGSDAALCGAAGQCMAIYVPPSVPVNPLPSVCRAPGFGPCVYAAPYPYPGFSFTPGSCNGSVPAGADGGSD